MLEIVVAMSILTFAVILFGSGMIAATTAESKSAQHTQAIMIGNYLLEQVRRDSYFWDASEWSGSGCVSPSNCWTATNSSNVDSKGSLLPPYDDALNTPPSSAAWHAGFIPVSVPNLALPAYHYIWRADPIDPTKFTGTKGVAALTIEIYVDREGTQDVYILRGMNRLQ